MKSYPKASSVTLQQVTSQVYELLKETESGPTEEDIRRICETLYAASLLKEEGRPVRARLMIAPPSAFHPETGPPDGAHAIRFSTAHSLTPNEIKRLSPAASFFHSIIAIWPDKSGKFRIWGLLNTGPRWMNLVAGGRKPIGEEILHPSIHVRDPGWLLFYHGYHLLAEWRGTEFHDHRIDVFQSKILNERFVKLRLRMIEELSEGCLPPTVDLTTYTDLSHLIALQFIKRVINLVRTSGHGGSLVILPPGDQGLDAATRWIDCKYSAEPDEAGLRFRRLLQSIVRRVGMLCEPGASVEEAWHLFRNSNDHEIDRLEEAFFELARLFSDLMQVDGALVLDQRMCIIGFGGEIRVDRNVLRVDQSMDLDGTQLQEWNVQADGTRHRSVYRLCSVEPETLGFVISQDSQVRLIANVNESVVFWAHTMI